MRVPLTGALQDGVRRAQGVVELDEVELLQLVEHRPVLALGRRRTRGRGRGRSSQRPCSPRLTAAAAEQPVQLGVVGLALLPAGGHRGDRRVGVRIVRDDLVQGGPALRTQGP